MRISEEENVIRLRSSRLKLAEALGNASEASRRRGVSRTQFYEDKQLFRTHGR